MSKRNKRSVCCVKTCRKKAEDGIYLFNVPVGTRSQMGAQRRRKWLRALGLPSYSPRNLGVCNKHFCENDFTTGIKTNKFMYLKRDAVPHLQVRNETKCHCHIYQDDLEPEKIKGVIVKSNSIAHLLGKTENREDNSVYLVQKCNELQRFTQNAIGEPSPLETSLQNKLKTKSLKIMIPGCKMAFQMCRICGVPLIDDKQDLSNDMERSDVKTIKTMLGLLLPTVEWDMYKNPVICAKCLDLVEKNFTLIQSFITTTEKLNNLFEDTTAVRSEVDLVVEHQQLLEVPIVLNKN